MSAASDMSSDLSLSGARQEVTRQPGRRLSSQDTIFARPFAPLPPTPGFWHSHCNALPVIHRYRDGSDGMVPRREHRPMVRGTAQSLP
jgi:hypothetical protein